MRQRIILGLLFPLLLLLGSEVGEAYTWGPACQWIRLHGRIEIDPGFVPKEPILLTVTYQTEDQKVPAVLLSSYPLSGFEFFFVLSPFREQIDKAVFLPIRFPFEKAVHFQYFATAANGLHRSDFLTVDYEPQFSHRGQEFLCKTDLSLGTIKLGRKKL